jgi:quercetin dioxygenase-like cupin family protein
MDLSNQYCYFYDDAAFKETDRPGFRRRVINGDQLQLCFWRISGGAKGSVIHRHSDAEQLGVIVRGALDFRISDDKDTPQRITLKEGEVYLAPMNVWHGDSVFLGDDELNECWILDVFAPPREDMKNG